MKISRPTLKAEARQALSAARPGSWRFTLIYLLLTSGISLLVSLLVRDPITRLLELTSAGLPLHRSLMVTLGETGLFGLFFYVLALLLVVVLDFSYQQWCLGSTRGGVGEWRDLLGGFAMAGRVLLLRLILLLYCFILISAAIMAASLLSGIAMFTSVFGLFTVIPLFLAAFVFAFWRILHYSMAPYCLMDNPDMGAAHAMHASRTLMRGHCGQYILLCLSFLGWSLLGLLIQLAGQSLTLLAFASPWLFNGTLDQTILTTIATVTPALELSVLVCWPYYAWLLPYQHMTFCRFYDTLRNAQQPEPTEA